MSEAGTHRVEAVPIADGNNDSSLSGTFEMAEHVERIRKLFGFAEQDEQCMPDRFL